MARREAHAPTLRAYRRDLRAFLAMVGVAMEAGALRVAFRLDAVTVAFLAPLVHLRHPPPPRHAIHCQLKSPDAPTEHMTVSGSFSDRPMSLSARNVVTDSAVRSSSH